MAHWCFCSCKGRCNVSADRHLAASAPTLILTVRYFPMRFLTQLTNVNYTLRSKLRIVKYMGAHRQMQA
jgi:hypothetical protein